MVKGSKRALWNASAAVALVLPAAAFSFAHGSATGARRVAAPAAAPAMMVTGMSAPLQVTRPGLAIIGPAAAAPVPDQLALHAAITAAWRQHLQAVIAADRARAAARRAAARRAAARRAAAWAAAHAAAHAAAQAAARAAARAVTARRARAGLTARVRAAAAAVPAAAGSWQQIVALLAGRVPAAWTTSSSTNPAAACTPPTPTPAPTASRRPCRPPRWPAPGPTGRPTRSPKCAGWCNTLTPRTAAPAAPGRTGRPMAVTRLARRPNRRATRRDHIDPPHPGRRRLGLG